MTLLEEVRVFWDRQPCNVKHGLSCQGSPTYFDEVRRRRYKVEPHIAALAEFDLWDGKTVLDLGCGIGTDAVQFALGGAEVTGMDISPRSLRLARQNALASSVDVQFIEGNIENVCEFVVPFDLVYSFGAIHHTPNPERVIAALRRCMKPGAELRIMLYAKWSWKNLMVRLGFARREAQADCPVAYRYTAKAVRHLLAGFDVTDIVKAHHFTFSIPEYRRGEYREVLPWRWLPAVAKRLFARVLGTQLLVIARRGT